MQSVNDKWHALRDKIIQRQKYLQKVMLGWLKNQQMLHDLLTCLQYLETEVRQQEPVYLKDSPMVLKEKYLKLRVIIFENLLQI